MNENEVLPHTQIARKDKKEETRRKALTGTNVKRTAPNPSALQYRDNMLMEGLAWGTCPQGLAQYRV